MKQLILGISVILSIAIHAQEYISAPNGEFRYSNDYVNGDVFAMNKGIAGGEFTVINDSGAVNIYDFTHNRQVGTNAELFIPIEKVLTLSDTSYYTRAIRVNQGDTVLIYTPSYDDEWRVLDPHDGVPAGWEYNDVKLQSIFYMNDLPAYMYSVYQGSIGTDSNSRRSELYLYNFNTESFELVYQHFFPNSFFIRDIENISHTEVFWYEGFGSNRLGIWSFNEVDKSVNRTMYNTIDLANIVIANGFHHAYNHVDNEVLLAILAQEISNNNNLIQGVYRLKLNELISGPRLEKKFELSFNMDMTSNNFKYVDDSLIGQGYLWYHRRPNGQTLTYETGEDTFFGPGLYLISSQMNSSSNLLGNFYNTHILEGICANIYTNSGKVYLSSNNYLTSGNVLPVLVYNTITQQLTHSNGLLVLDFNEYVEELITTDSIVIINKIDSMFVGQSHAFEAVQYPANVDSAGVIWSLEILEGENLGELIEMSSPFVQLITALNEGVVKIRVSAIDNENIFDEHTVVFYNKSDQNEDNNITSLNNQSGLETLIWPNPTSEKLLLKNFPDEERLLYNMTGKLVGRFNATQTSIDLLNYPKGLYFLNVGSISKKVIVF